MFQRLKIQRIALGMWQMHCLCHVEHFSGLIILLNQKHVCWNKLAELQLVNSHRLAQTSVRHHDIVNLKHKAAVVTCLR